jgi:hypothetical protein
MKNSRIEEIEAQEESDRVQVERSPTAMNARSLMVLQQERRTLIMKRNTLLRPGTKYNWSIAWRLSYSQTEGFSAISKDI